MLEQELGVEDVICVQDGAGPIAEILDDIDNFINLPNKLEKYYAKIRMSLYI